MKSTCLKRQVLDQCKLRCRSLKYAKNPYGNLINATGKQNSLCFFIRLTTLSLKGDSRSTKNDSIFYAYKIVDLYAYTQRSYIGQIV